VSSNCTICPRHCFIPVGKTGFCGVRSNGFSASADNTPNNNNDGGIFSLTYGKNTGLVVDPVEKKPLYHFYPTSKTLSLGSIGCNFDCKFCQNFLISRSTDVSALVAVSPSDVVNAALRAGCRSVAFTYNEPVIWLEYVIDIAKAAHRVGLSTIAVTNGYISPEHWDNFFGNIDAANVDLKSFSDDFYREYCSASIEPVKATLCYLRKMGEIRAGVIPASSKRGTWFEITTLLIPELNDSEAEVGELSSWIFSNLGGEVPLHFSAFRPADRLRSISPTPAETLFRARETALAAGLKYVYTGNIDDPAGQSTFCPQCKQSIISRERFNVTEYLIDEDQCCRYCGQTIAGEFDTETGEFHA
jgi:pyruvate formate lyase activating enzyme